MIAKSVIWIVVTELPYHYEKYFELYKSIQIMKNSYCPGQVSKKICILEFKLCVQNLWLWDIP